LAARHRFLIDAGLAVWPDGTRTGTYRFRHALYQQVLYEQLGGGRRAQLHWRIGKRLEAGYGSRLLEVVTQLAVHSERSGEVWQAVQYWWQAAHHDAQRGAHHEAISALRKGLALLAMAPVSCDRLQYELRLQLSLGELLMIARGMGSPEAGEAYVRAHALCIQLGEQALHLRVLSNLTLFYTTQARFAIAQEFGRQLLSQALAQKEWIRMREGYLTLGTISLHRGDLVTARRLLEQALEFSTPQPHMAVNVDDVASSGLVGGISPLVASLTWLMRTLWLLGYADQARLRSDEARTRARELNHAPSIAYAEYFGTILYQCRRDVSTARARAETLMAFATAQGLLHRVDQGRIILGWAYAMQGDAAGVPYIQRGLASHQSMGIMIAQPYYLALMAEAYGHAGQPGVGLTALDKALNLVAMTEERWWEGEIHRLRGDLLLQLPTPDVPQAEDSFHRALEVSRSQQARGLELRAALSFARLQQSQGKRADARRLLEGVYYWFTEGFETSDMRACEGLLEELA
jgi:adenylate cyclase